MNKKKVFGLSIFLILFVCVIIYYKPLTLSDVAKGNNEIFMTLSIHNYEYRNGEPYSDMIINKDFSSEQKDTILTLFEDYKYRRVWNTPFSDGALSDTGDYSLTLHVIGDDLWTDVVIITSSGKMAVNGKEYVLKNADIIFEQIVEIVE